MKVSKEKHNEYQRRWRTKHREAVNAYHRAWKKNSSKWKEQHRLQVAKARALNPQKYRDINNKSRLKHLKERQAMVRIWASKHRKELQEYSREWRQANKEYDKQRRLANPEYFKAKGLMAHKRRDKRIRKLCDLTIKDLRSLLERAKAYGICPLCKQKPDKWHLDHAIPLGREGTHTKDNVYFCCHTCNLQKGTKTLEEFAGIKFEELPIRL
jgi:hypothetical protein